MTFICLLRPPTYSVCQSLLVTLNSRIRRQSVSWKPSSQSPGSAPIPVEPTTVAAYCDKHSKHWGMRFFFSAQLTSCSTWRRAAPHTRWLSSAAFHTACPFREPVEMSSDAQWFEKLQLCAVQGKKQSDASRVKVSEILPNLFSQHFTVRSESVLRHRRRTRVKS